MELVDLTKKPEYHDATLDDPCELIWQQQSQQMCTLYYRCFSKFLLYALLARYKGILARQLSSYFLIAPR